MVSGCKGMCRCQQSLVDLWRLWWTPTYELYAPIGGEFQTKVSGPAFQFRATVASEAIFFGSAQPLHQGSSVWVLIRDEFDGVGGGFLRLVRGCSNKVSTDQY